LHKQITADHNTIASLVSAGRLNSSGEGWSGWKKVAGKLTPENTKGRKAKKRPGAEKYIPASLF
jgi:hypothetical protein